MNRQNEYLGTIEHLMIDIENGRVAYAVLSFERFAGTSDAYIAIPWSAITVDADTNRLILDINEQLLARAPGLHKAHWPDMADRAWATEVFSYYGAKPYWM